MKLLEENITKIDKKVNLTKRHNTNRNTNKIIEKLTISDKVAKMKETEAYVTIQKESFPQKILCRLINLSTLALVKLARSFLIKLIMVIIINNISIRK